MKNVIVLMALVGLVQIANADIPLPHNPSTQTEATSVTVSGAAAEQLWEKIKTPVIQGSSSGYTGETTVYKVLRSEDGLEQTVCTSQSNFRTKTAPVTTCTTQKSTNGKPLPQFLPVVRMG